MDFPVAGHMGWHREFRSSGGACEIPMGPAEEAGWLRQYVLINQEVVYIPSQLHHVYPHFIVHAMKKKKE